jgi:hypothetical protein
MPQFEAVPVTTADEAAFEEEGDSPVEWTSYRPSGRFDPLRLAIGFGVALAVAIAMAFVLLWVGEHFYIYFIAPFGLAIPVFIAAWVMIRFGRCRNPALGSLLTGLLLLVYYVGYWELSYRRHVLDQGPMLTKVVELIGGAPGLAGYFNFHCKTTMPARPGAPPPMREPTVVDQVFNYFLYGGELVGLLLAGLAVGQNGSRRAFSEGRGKWTEPYEFRVPLTAGSTLREAVQGQDWSTVATIPRVGAIGSNPAECVAFRLEYLPGCPDEPGYVSIKRPGKKPKNAMSDLRQQRLTPESVQALLAVLPGAKRSASSQGAIIASTNVPVAHLTKDVQADDFRTPAALASRAFLETHRIDPSEPLRSQVSLCLAAGEPRRSVTRFGILRMLLPLASMAVFFGGGGVAVGLGKNPKMESWALPSGATVMGLGFLGMVAFTFGGTAIFKRLLAARLFNRSGSLIPYMEQERLPRRLLNLENARTYHQAKLASDDFVICGFDAAHHRFLLEGVRHRYVLNAVDVVKYFPLESGNVASVQLETNVLGELVLEHVRRNGVHRGCRLFRVPGQNFAMTGWQTPSRYPSFECRSFMP